MAIVFSAVDETEVFVNQGGSITIKQTDGFGEESIVAIPVFHVDALIGALIEARS